MSRIAGMDICVVANDDWRVRDLPPEHIATDGVRIYVPEAMWPRLKEALWPYGKVTALLYPDLVREINGE